MAKQVLSKAGRLFHWRNSGDLRGRAPYSGLAVTTLVAASVGMMIIPLPTFLLDLLISFDIAIAVVLLLISIYVRDGLSIATFPSLLLLITLFRLAIAVSATRLILLNADAGQVIFAFGSFVVGANLVVGIVVFAILTTVQFIVVAKGAERVAEVGARFTLDSLPGKQLAIDAELRAGHIELQEAQNRRRMLVRESQFFGAMDGAMRFVKGDAIAGIIILIANIAGGLVIGVVQRGMSLGSAARIYTLLTIGEGLVAQIPSIVICTAAGIVVTRVSSNREDAHLGSEIAEEVLAQPRALAFSSALLALLGLVPGLPALPFLALAAILAFVAYQIVRQGTRVQGAGRGVSAYCPDEAELLPALTLDLSPEFPKHARTRLASELLARQRELFFAETGIPVPTVQMRERSDLPAGAYSIRVHDVVVASGRAVVGERPGKPEEAIADDLLQALRRHGHSLVGVDETQALLDRLARTHPNLVREVVPKLLSPVLLAEILQCLAKEGICLRHLAAILSALAKSAPLRGNGADLAEIPRASLQPQLTAKFARPDGSIPVFLLDPAVEETLREAIQKGESGSFLALEPELGRDVVDSLGRTVAGVKAPVVMTTPEIRRHLRGLIENDHPHVAVLSFQDLLPQAKLQTQGRVSVEDRQHA